MFVLLEVPVQLIGAGVSALLAATEIVGAGTAAVIGNVVTWTLTAAYLGYGIYRSLTQKPASQEGPRLSDLSVQSSTRGRPLPRIWGSMRVSGNLIAGKKYEVSSEQGGGKNMKSSGNTQLLYEYFADFAITLCDNEIGGVRRIWLNNKLFWDADDPNVAASRVDAYFTVYTGTQTTVDPVLYAIWGAECPVYKGISYIVFNRLPLLNYANSIPSVSCEIVNQARTWDAVVHLSQRGGMDAAPAQNPNNGEIWFPSYERESILVYDRLGETLLHEIPFPGLDHEGDTTGMWTLYRSYGVPYNLAFDSKCCYVTITDEVWCSFANDYQARTGLSYPLTHRSCAIFDATSHELKDVILLVGSGMFGCLVYHAGRVVYINPTGGGDPWGCIIDPSTRQVIWTDLPDEVYTVYSPNNSGSDQVPALGPGESWPEAVRGTGGGGGIPEDPDIPYDPGSFTTVKYIRAGASGANNGTDWTNAYTAIPATLTRDCLYYIANGNYAGMEFDTAASGTDLIVIRHATIAEHGTETGWSDSYASQTCFTGGISFTSEYWIIDGQTGGGASGNWSGNFGIKITETSDEVPLIGVGTPGGSHESGNIILRHIDFIGKGSAATHGGSYSNDGLAVYGNDDIVLSYYHMSGIGRCPFFLSAGDFVAEHGWVESYHAGAVIHGEIASIWPFSAPLGDVTFRYNLFTDIKSTGGLIWDSDGTSAAFYVYGNVFYKPAGAVWDEANGLIGGWTARVFSNVRVYNNTFINVDQKCLSDLSTTYSNNAAYNNIFCNCDAPTFSRFANHDYNFFIGSGTTQGEAHGIAASLSFPFVDYTGLDFRLSAATSAGMTLSSPFDSDPLGNVRGDDGVWDLGAFDYVSVEGGGEGGDGESYGGAAHGYGGGVEWFPLDFTGSLVQDPFAVEAPYNLLVITGWNSQMIQVYDAGLNRLISCYRADLWPASSDIEIWAFWDDRRDRVVVAVPQSTTYYTWDFTRYPIDGSWEGPTAHTLPTEPNGGMAYWYPNGNYVFYTMYKVGEDSYTEFMLNPDTGLVVDSFAPDNKIVEALAKIYTLPMTPATIHWNSAVWQHRAEMSAEAVPLSQIVTDICVDCGLEESDIDVSELTDLVHGYARTEQADGVATLEPLMVAYAFDCVESDWMLKFKKRKTAADLYLGSEILAAHEIGQDMPSTADVTQLQEVELPVETTVNYVAPSIQYQQGTQSFWREISQSRNKITQDLPIAMGAEKAREIAIRLMNLAWVERTAIAFKLDNAYLQLDPCDVVNVEFAEGAFLVRLTKTSYGPPGIIECEGIAIRSPYLSGTVAPGQIGIYDPPDGNAGWPDDVNGAPDESMPVSSRSQAMLLNTPMLREEDDSAGFYYALQAVGGNTWRGGSLYKSYDMGASFSRLSSVSTQATAGAVATPVQGTTSTLFDYTDSITVVLDYGTLASDTADNVLNWSNVAAYGQDGRWEIIQWLNAELIAESTYRLTGLLRGRLGTQWAMASHALYDDFVVLNMASIRSISEPLSEVGVGRIYSAVSFGQALEEGIQAGFTDTGERLKPFPPVHPAGERDESGDLIIDWVRSSRVDNVWRDYADVALGESSELYELDVLSGDGSTVLRTISSSSPSATYTAAQQSADFGTPPETVTVRIYQLSSAVGRGNPVEAIL